MYTGANVFALTKKMFHKTPNLEIYNIVHQM